MMHLLALWNRDSKLVGLEQANDFRSPNFQTKLAGRLLWQHSTPGLVLVFRTNSGGGRPWMRRSWLDSAQRPCNSDYPSSFSTHSCFILAVVLRLLCLQLDHNRLYLFLKDEDYSAAACCITTSGGHGHEGIASCLSIPTHGAEFPTTLLYLVPPSLLQCETACQLALLSSMNSLQTRWRSGRNPSGESKIEEEKKKKKKRKRQIAQIYLTLAFQYP